MKAIDYKGALELFDGVMLSDGSLCLPLHRRSAHFQMNLSSIRGKLKAEDLLGFLAHVAEALKVIGVGISPRSPKECWGTDHAGSRYSYFRLCTLSSPFLTAEHRRWYPTEVKEVPRDLVLTPISLAYWFMGDGKYRRYDCTASSEELSTVGFNIQSIGLLEGQLHNLGILDTSRWHYQHVRKGAGIAIAVLQASSNKFMELVRPYIVTPYHYKLGQKTALRREQ